MNRAVALRAITIAWTSARGARAALVAMLVIAAAALAAALALDAAAAARPGSTSRMVIYLAPDSDARARELAGVLTNHPGVLGVEVTSTATAHARLLAALGNDRALLDGIEPALLPSSLELVLAPGVRDVAAFSHTIQELTHAPGVSDVVVEAPADDAVAHLLQRSCDAAWLVATALCVLAGWAVFALLRLRLAPAPRLARLGELHGAGATFLMLPTALAGALVMAIAAGLAIAALALTTHVADLPRELTALDVSALATFVAASSLLGLVSGAFACVARRSPCGALV